MDGVFSPRYDEDHTEFWNGWYSECGVCMRLKNTLTDEEYTYTDYRPEEKDYLYAFTSKNVEKLLEDPLFRGFHTGDSCVFRYHDRLDESERFYPEAEFQFADVDFDGEDELLIGAIHSGPDDATLYEVYELTGKGLVRKAPLNEPANSFYLYSTTELNEDARTMTNSFYENLSEWTDYVYAVNEQHDWYLQSRVEHEWDYNADTLISRIVQ